MEKKIWRMITRERGMEREELRKNNRDYRMKKESRKKNGERRMVKGE